MKKKMILRSLFAVAVFCAYWAVDIQAMSAKEEKMAEDSPSGMLFQSADTSERGFGVSVQDLIGRDAIPAIKNGFLNLAGRNIDSLEGLENIPGIHEVRYLELDGNWITSLEGVQFPQSLELLGLSDNRIKSLVGSQFPQGLKIIDLSYNQISSFAGAEFPAGLKQLFLEGNSYPISTQIDELRKAQPNLDIAYYEKKPKVITLKSNDDKEVTFEKNLWKTSGTLRNLFDDTHDFENSILTSRYTEEQLLIARSLMELEQKLASTNSDLEQRAEAIKHELYLDPHKGARSSEFFDIASFFDLPIVGDAIAYSVISPELVHKQAWSKLENFDYSGQLLEAMEKALETKIALAKEKYFETGDTSDPYFTGVSIQDLINHDQIPAIANARLDLSNKNLNSLVGLENIQGIDDVRSLNLNNNQIETLEGIQSMPALRSLEVHHNHLESLEGIQSLLVLERLHAANNRIETLEGIQFPSTLKWLQVADNLIKSLAGVQFPQSLQKLFLNGNRIESFKEAVFPQALTWINVRNNQIKSIEAAQLPPDLRILSIGGNPIPKAQLEAIKEVRPGLKFSIGGNVLLIENDSQIGSLAGVVFPPFVDNE